MVVPAAQRRGANLRMNPDWWQLVKELFEAALLQAPEERSRWLAEVCHEPDVRKEVESLLAAHDRAGEFIQRPVAVDTVGVIASLAARDRQGELVGAWRLLQE